MAILTAALAAALPARADEPQPAPDPGKAIVDWWQNLTRPPPPRPEPPGAQNTITLNPLALRYQQLGIEYERALGPVFSIYLSPQAAYGVRGGASSLQVGAEAGLRVFFLGKAPVGLWIGPEVSGTYGRVSSDGVTRWGVGTGVGGGAGWTLVFFDRFALSVGFAAVYRSVPDLESVDETIPGVEFLPLPRLAFGVAF
ncbi:MAG TPA: hypothetical protein VND93_26440 [Myxococcales bacterium]|nr:hypothetical protein [Myxococcales bacterium]